MEAFRARLIFFANNLPIWKDAVLTSMSLNNRREAGRTSQTQTLPRNKRGFEAEGEITGCSFPFIIK